MTDLTLYGRRVETVFELLGEADITYSVGWGLAQSGGFTRALLAEVYGPNVPTGDLTAVRLQKMEKGTGRTDVEVESEFLHLIVEAKRGWQLPTYGQLEQYARRLRNGEPRQTCIVVIAECAPYYAPVAALPKKIYGIPITYLPWSRIAELVRQSATACRHQGERQLLRELHRYLRRLMTVQNTTSNLVYVVTLQDMPLEWSDISYMQMVYRHNRYFHPVGGPWPKTPVNYLGFRSNAHLQRVQHVERYEVTTRLHDYMPEIHQGEESELYFVYFLGPPIEPPVKIHMGKMQWHGRAWAALDLLLTAQTITEARDLTKARHEAAGIPFP